MWCLSLAEFSYIHTNIHTYICDPVLQTSLFLYCLICLHDFDFWYWFFNLTRLEQAMGAKFEQVGHMGANRVAEEYDTTSIVQLPSLR